MGPGPMGHIKRPWAKGPWAQGPWTHGPMGPWAHEPMSPWALGLSAPTAARALGSNGALGPMGQAKWTGQNDYEQRWTPAEFP